MGCNFVTDYTRQQAGKKNDANRYCKFIHELLISVPNQSRSLRNFDGLSPIALQIKVRSAIVNCLCPFSYFETNDWGLRIFAATSAWVSAVFFRSVANSWLIRLFIEKVSDFDIGSSENCLLRYIPRQDYPELGYYPLQKMPGEGCLSGWLLFKPNGR